MQRYGERVEEGLAAWHAKAAGNCAIDYGFHQIIGGVDEFSLKAMDSLIDEGVTSFKLFMAYPGVFYSDDAQILKAMQKSAETGLLTMMHAENGPAIDVLAEQLYSAGKTTPYYHGIARAWQMEEEATHRAIMIANLTGAPLYVVHVSAKQAVEQIAAARDGARTSSARPVRSTSISPWRINSARPASRARSGSARHRCGRAPRVIRTRCGRRCARNDLQMVSTDHCPFCMKEQKELGLGDFRAIPNGIGCIEHRMDLMYSGRRDRPDLAARWVELTSTTPARMFGLYGTQGRHPAGRRRRPGDLRPERPHLDRRTRRPTT